MALAGAAFRSLSRALAALRPTPPPPPRLAPGARVLVGRSDHLGDLLMSLPAIASLAAGCQGPVDLLVKAPYAPLLEGQPGVGRVFGFTLPWQGGGRRAFGGLGALRAAVRAGGYGLAVELTEDVKNAALLGWLTGAPVVAPSTPGAGAWADLRVPTGAPHQVERALQVAAGIGGAPVADTPRLVGFEPGAAALAPGTVVLHAGAASMAKAWPLEHLVALAGLLRARGNGVVGLLGPDDGDARDALVAAGIPLRQDLALGQAAALLAGAALVVASDTGVAHLAAAVGAPVAVLFGPTDPGLTAARGPRVRVISRRLACSPCWAPRTRFRCPTRRECLVELTPEAVLAALEDQLGTAPSSA